MIVRFSYALFKSAANNYCIYLYKNIETKEKVTCIGYDLPTLKINYEFTTEEIEHPKYGKQYKVLRYTEVVGKNKNSIIEYLTSGLIKGIGPKTAEKVYAAFGNDTLDIIENTPERLLEISGISQKKYDKFIASYEENHLPGDILDYFVGYGFNTEQICKFYKFYKRDLIDKVKLNPFILCNFKGVTFKDADAIHKDLGYKLNSSDRIYAACHEVILNNMHLGAVGMVGNTLLAEVCALSELEKDEVKKVIFKLMKDKKLGWDRADRLSECGITTYFYLPFVQQTEHELADMVIKLSTSGKDETDKASKLLKDVKSTLDDSQKNAVLNCFSCHFSVVTGGPGTGKTTTIKEIIRINKAIYPHMPILLMAPTGLAARRMVEATGLPATTIHRGLELDVHPSDEIKLYDEDDSAIITDSLLIIDEFSMVDMFLAHKILSSIRNTRVILVGDVDQLPSIGSGNVLKDIINSDIVKTTYLRYIHRQSGDSTICENAHNIREGIGSLVEADDFKIVYSDNSLKELQDAMVDEYVKAYNDPSVKSIMCLAPYKKYEAGVFTLNNAIQEKINPLNGRIEVKGLNGMSFRVGDKVMHILSNEKDVVNGDIGKVTRIRKDDDDYVIEVEYETPTGAILKEYEKSDLKNLTLAYAMTIHKAQGSECDKVIMCLTSFHKMMLKRKILYTGITRAKNNVTLFTTSKELIKEVINNTYEVSRNTLLDIIIKRKTNTLYVQETLNL